MFKKSVEKSGICAIIPAAGKGLRMQASQPKQYLMMNHYTIIEHTLLHFINHPEIIKIIVVISAHDNFFSTLPIANHQRIKVTIGGETRAESVLAGLQAIPADIEWVLVHDAVRPCLHQDDLNRLLASRYECNHGAILASPVQDTLKYAEKPLTKIDRTINRENLWRGLTPQLFPYQLLLSCLQQAFTMGYVITDESSAVEYCGYHPLLVPGRNDNIKITQPEDLALATYIVNQRSSEGTN